MIDFGEFVTQCLFSILGPDKPGPPGPPGKSVLEKFYWFWKFFQGFWFLLHEKFDFLNFLKDLHDFIKCMANNRIFGK